MKKFRPNKPFKIRGFSWQRSRKTTFIDEALAVSKEIPGANKYKLDHSKLLSKYFYLLE